ncbi:hypothetical protein BDW59DRAFT_165008 [Aspergillus cavernicola]|uniref:GPI anchored protein n=1 Tax=Aspergillus cavernicola TaxID=176166 RepID=A0ABR4HVY3_9EURO
MHAKYLTLLTLSSAALGQDWLSDAYDALSATTDYPTPTGLSGDNTLDEYLDDNDYLEDLDVTNDFGDSDDSSDDDSSSSSSPTSSSSSSDDSDNMFGDIPSSILTELATAIPSSVLQELATPASLSSLYSEVADGNFPAWVTDLPDDVRDYLESAWDVDTSAIPTGSASSDDEDSSSSSSSDDDNNDNNNNSNSNGDNEDAAGMLSPSVMASFVGAVGVLGLALAL